MGEVREAGPGGGGGEIGGEDDFGSGGGVGAGSDIVGDFDAVDGGVVFRGRLGAAPGIEGGVFVIDEEDCGDDESVGLFFDERGEGVEHLGQGRAADDEFEGGILGNEELFGAAAFGDVSRGAGDGFDAPLASKTGVKMYS